MEEYVTIVEASRRLGLTTKRSQRAIKAGHLEARYPHPNKAEISIADLEVWHATLHVRPGETQDRLKALELQVAECFVLWQKTQAGMDALEVQLENLRFESCRAFCHYTVE